MSLDTDKQATLDFLLKARARVEEALASFNNGDFTKMKVRIEQHDEAMRASGAQLGIVVDKTSSVEAAQAEVGISADMGEIK